MLPTGFYALLLFLAVPISSVAQQPQTPAQADPQEVRALLQLIGFNQQIDAFWNSIAPMQAENIKAAVTAQLKTAGKEVDPKKVEKAAATFTDAFRKLFTSEALEGEMVAIYQKHFTREEIRALLEFWGSPLGKKLSSKTPVLIQEGAGAGRKLAEQAVGKLLQDPAFIQKLNGILEADAK